MYVRALVAEATTRLYALLGKWLRGAPYAPPWLPAAVAGAGGPDEWTALVFGDFEEARVALDSSAASVWDTTLGALPLLAGTHVPRPVRVAVARWAAGLATPDRVPPGGPTRGRSSITILLLWRLAVLQHLTTFAARKTTCAAVESAHAFETPAVTRAYAEGLACLRAVTDCHFALLSALRGALAAAPDAAGAILSDVGLRTPTPALAGRTPYTVFYPRPNASPWAPNVPRVDVQLVGAGLWDHSVSYSADFIVHLVTKALPRSCAMRAMARLYANSTGPPLTATAQDVYYTTTGPHTRPLSSLPPRPLPDRKGADRTVKGHLTTLTVRAAVVLLRHALYTTLVGADADTSVFTVQTPTRLALHELLCGSRGSVFFRWLLARLRTEPVTPEEASGARLQASVTGRGGRRGLPPGTTRSRTPAYQHEQLLQLTMRRVVVTQLPGNPALLAAVRRFYAWGEWTAAVEDAVTALRERVAKWASLPVVGTKEPSVALPRHILWHHITCVLTRLCAGAQRSHARHSNFPWTRRFAEDTLNILAQRVRAAGGVRRAPPRVEFPPLVHQALAMLVMRFNDDDPLPAAVYRELGCPVDDALQMAFLNAWWRHAAHKQRTTQKALKCISSRTLAAISAYTTARKTRAQRTYYRVALPARVRNAQIAALCARYGVRPGGVLPYDAGMVLVCEALECAGDMKVHVTGCPEHSRQHARRRPPSGRRVAEVVGAAGRLAIMGAITLPPWATPDVVWLRDHMLVTNVPAEDVVCPQTQKVLNREFRRNTPLLFANTVRSTCATCMALSDDCDVCGGRAVRFFCSDDEAEGLPDLLRPPDHPSSHPLHLVDAVGFCVRAGSTCYSICVCCGGLQAVHDADWSGEGAPVCLVCRTARAMLPVYGLAWGAPHVPVRYAWVDAPSGTDPRTPSGIPGFPYAAVATPMPKWACAVCQTKMDAHQHRLIFLYDPDADAVSRSAVCCDCAARPDLANGRFASTAMELFARLPKTLARTRRVTVTPRDRIRAAVL